MTTNHQNNSQKTEAKAKPIIQRDEQMGMEQVQETSETDTSVLQRVGAPPASLTPEHVLQLQRLYGNAAVGQLLGRDKPVQRKPFKPIIHPIPGIQPKLKVGPANDRYEQEADSMAEHVMRTPTVESKPAVQREEEEELQAKHISTLQRDGGADGFEVGSDFQSQLSRSGGGSPLPKQIQSEFSSKMGADMSGVRVHTGEKAAKMNTQIQAKAFTHGSDIYMGSGQYNPGSGEGKRLLAHEATHTIQQGASPVQTKRIEDLSIGQKSTKNIQRAWIGLDKKSQITFRYWKQTSGDEEIITDGWYKLTNIDNPWEAGNISAASTDEAQQLGTEDDMLPDDVDNVTRYTGVTADPLSEGAKKKIDEEAKKESNLAPNLEAKVRKYGTTLKTAHTTYRWGEYQYEKNYVARNGFSLGNVNFGSSQYGPGMYVATTPWGSASYATEKDGSLLQVKIPKGAFYLDETQTKTIGVGKRGNGTYGLKHKYLFDGGEQSQIQNNPRFPQVLLVSKQSGWAVIKDDRLKLEIDFYQPSPKEYAKVAPHLLGMQSLSGYTAVQIINRQMGNPIPLPPKEELLSLYINQPPVKMKKLQKYIQQISKFEFVPFLLSKNGLDFVDSVKNFMGSYKNPGTARYKKYFSAIEPTLLEWAANPFSLEKNDFETVVKAPFSQALTDYKADRDTQKEKGGWAGFKLKHFSSGDKEKKLGQFEKRLGRFGNFMQEIESNHNDLGDETKASHQGIKVGRHHGMMSKGANKDEQKEAITKTMMKGVAPVSGIGKTRQAIIMMGLPGSGKSSVISQIAPDIHNYVVADPDDAKEGLPEYQAGIKAGNKGIAGEVHNESKDITNNVVNQTISTHRNLIYDTTGTGIQRDFIQRLKTAGYNVTLVYVHVTFDEAKKRVKSREETTMRSIPDSVMDSVKQLMSISLFSLAPAANKVKLYNNMGSSPQLVWSGSGSAANRETLTEQIKSMK